MLVLTRKVNEEIEIGDNITIKLLRISGDRVRIGVEAPPSVKVLREEVARRISPVVTEMEEKKPLELKT